MADGDYFDYDDPDGNEIVVKCSECDGEGQLEYPDPPHGRTTHWDSCMDCGGKGYRLGTNGDLQDGAERVYPG